MEDKKNEKCENEKYGCCGCGLWAHIEQFQTILIILISVPPTGLEFIREDGMEMIK